MSRWDRDSTRKFIALYKSHPCIWNKTLPHYKDQNARSLAFNEIVRAMEIPITVKEVKMKIKSLRSTYSQELRKIKTKLKEGASPVTKLEWFDDFKSTVTPSKTVKINFEDSEPEHEQELNSDTNDETEDTFQEEYVIEDPYEIMLDQQTSMGRRRALEKRSTQQNTPEDEFTVFSHTVATQLRMMPLKNALRMQLKIQTLLTEERIKLEEEQDYL